MILQNLTPHSICQPQAKKNVFFSGDEFVIVTDYDPNSATATNDVPTTGEIFLNQELDWYSKGQQYVLKIVATDTFSGSTRAMPTATVTVGVIDGNNNAPFFDPAYYHKSFPENTATGTTVVTLQVKIPWSLE